MNKLSLIFTCLFGLCAALPSTKIIGGEDAEQGELPYMVRIHVEGMDDNNTYCGATLCELNGKQFVLTSATCVKVSRLEPDMKFWLIAGELKVSARSGFEQERLTNRIIISPEFEDEPYTKAGEIALLAFETPFNLTNDVQPISLPPQGWNATGMVRISGWGYSEKTGNDSDHLQWLELPLISKDLCQELYEPNYFTPDNRTLCAISHFEDNAHCFADQGGPVVSVDEGYLAGIMIHPDFCNQNRTFYPDVYTEVSAYSDWIIRTAEDL